MKGNTVQRHPFMQSFQTFVTGYTFCFFMEQNEEGLREGLQFTSVIPVKNSLPGACWGYPDPLNPPPAGDTHNVSNFPRHYRYVTQAHSPGHKPGMTNRGVLPGLTTLFPCIFSILHLSSLVPISFYPYF